MSLSKGDTIQFSNVDDAVRLADDLANDGYGIRLVFNESKIVIESVPEGDKGP